MCSHVCTASNCNSQVGAERVRNILWPTVRLGIAGQAQKSLSQVAFSMTDLYAEPKKKLHSDCKPFATDLTAAFLVRPHDTSSQSCSVTAALQYTTRLITLLTIPIQGVQWCVSVPWHGASIYAA